METAERRPGRIHWLEPAPRKTPKRETVPRGSSAHDEARGTEKAASPPDPGKLPTRDGSAGDEDPGEPGRGATLLARRGGPTPSAAMTTHIRSAASPGKGRVWVSWAFDDASCRRSSRSRSWPTQMAATCRRGSGFTSEARSRPRHGTERRCRCTRVEEKPAAVL